jgi:hypothetical protein
MTALMQQIEKAARGLSAREKELLAERLLSRARKARLTEVDEAWIAEAERRYHAWKAGQTRAVPAARALSSIRKELHK